MTNPKEAPEKGPQITNHSGSAPIRIQVPGRGSTFARNTSIRLELPLLTATASANDIAYFVGTSHADCPSLTVYQRATSRGEEVEQWLVVRLAVSTNAWYIQKSHAAASTRTNEAIPFISPPAIPLLPTADHL